MIEEPDLERDGWTLESAVERHQQHPEQFILPSEQSRNHLPLGCGVKLLFLLLGQGTDGLYVQCERMWVTVTEITTSGYVGRLESRPHTSTALTPGDLIGFRAEHVVSILLR
jgi:hypothetical protein